MSVHIHDGEKEKLLGEVPQLTDGNVKIGRTIWEILKLAMPMFVSRVAWVGMKMTDTSLLGHVDDGGNALAGASLSDLWTSSWGVFVQARVFSIFAGNAVGAGKPKMAGVWLQVSWSVLVFVSLITMGLWAITGPVLKAFKEPEVLVWIGWRYALILMSTIPMRVIISQYSSLLQAQKIMYPEVICALIAMSLNILAGVPLVLGVPFKSWKGFGFIAAPIVTASVEYIQGLLLLLLFRRLALALWPGWNLRKYVTKARVITYLKLYIPASLSIASDFWRLSVVGIVAATLGPTEVSVFNSSYRVMWLSLIFCGSCAGAMRILLTIAFGKGHPRDAKKVTFVGLTIILCFIVVLSVLVFFLSRQLGSIFSNQAEILDEFENIRLPFALVVFLMNLAVSLEQVPQSMGRPTIVLIIGLIGSWAVQVPLSFAFVKGIKVSAWTPMARLYFAVAAGYGVVSVLLVILILTTNWQKYADEAKARAEEDSSEKANKMIN